MARTTVYRICWNCKGIGTLNRRKSIGPQTCQACDGKGGKYQTLSEFVAQEKANGRYPQK